MNLYFEDFILDTEVPISAFLKLQNSDFTPLYLLESVEGGEKWGRYSFLGLGPPIATVRYFIEADSKRDPFAEIKEILDGMKESVNSIGSFRFFLGLVGYLSYDTFSIIEPVVNTFKGKDGIGVPDIYLVLSGNMIVFDNVRKTVSIICTDKANIKEIKKILNTPRFLEGIKEQKTLRLEDRVGEKEYLNYVIDGKKRIFRGDVIQVVLSRRLDLYGHFDPFSAYRMLRVINPSPYMYFLNFDEIKIVGTSPEMLVRYEGGKVETRPIAGTRRRGRNQEEDNLLEKELLSDPKELSEHLMLVDLARNDLGRVCKIGTVRVPRYSYIERYSSVMHITSDVEGITDESCSDVFKACFPAGTVVGAPKIEAAKIISETEALRRGPYAGAVGYFSFDSMDMAILIRTILFLQDKAYVQAGAGIVADSVPEYEFKETQHKIKTMLEVLGSNL